MEFFTYLHKFISDLFITDLYSPVIVTEVPYTRCWGTITNVHLFLPFTVDYKTCRVKQYSFGIPLTKINDLRIHSYALMSQPFGTTTQFTSYTQNVHHRPKRTRGDRN